MGNYIVPYSEVETSRFGCFLKPVMIVSERAHMSHLA